jgi:hypothetical protein
LVNAVRAATASDADTASSSSASSSSAPFTSSITTRHKGQEYSLVTSEDEERGEVKLDLVETDPMLDEGLLSSSLFLFLFCLFSLLVCAHVSQSFAEDNEQVDLLTPQVDPDLNYLGQNKSSSSSTLLADSSSSSSSTISSNNKNNPPRELKPHHQSRLLNLNSKP